MRKRRKSNLIQIFYDRGKFLRQCENMIDNVRMYLFFNVRKFRTPCAMTFTMEANGDQQLKVNYPFNV